MPIYVLRCDECHTELEVILKGKEDLTEIFCPKCASEKLSLAPTAPANYTIGGDNSASTRPRKGR